MGQAFVYKYKLPGLMKAPAEVAGAVCQQLTESSEGLTPKTLVDASRPEDAPLHNEFEWDDAIAGEKFREFQARKYIGNIIIVKSDYQTERELKLVEKHKENEEEEESKEHTDRGFVSTGGGSPRYVPLFSALTHDVWRQNLLEDAKRDMRTFTIKYHRLEELADIIDDMNDFLNA